MDALPIPPEPPPGQDTDKRRWNKRTGTRMRAIQRNDTQLQKMARRLKQLEDLNKNLIDDQMERNKAHAKELENCEKEQEKELENFHHLYAEKLKQ